jgi:hypothetical protein
MKTFQCDDCRVVYCDPWLSNEARKWLYDVASPQHSVGWGWFFSWADRDERHRDQLQPRLSAIWAEVCRAFPDRVSTYAEVNCPFTGLLPLFAEAQDPTLGSKRVSDFLRRQQAKLTHPQSQQLLTIPKLRLRERLARAASMDNHGRARRHDAARSHDADVSLPSPARRFLILSPSHSTWGRNCAALGSTCHGTAQGLLGVSVLHVDELKQQREPLDVLAFMNTLDHCDEPLKLLDTAVEHARLVLIENHDESGLEKQHLWGFSEQTVPHICQSKGWHFVELTSKIAARKNKLHRVFLISKELRF